MAKWYAVVLAGVNTEGVPENFPEADRRIPGEFDLAPPLPADFTEERAKGAIVMSEEALLASRSALWSAYNSSQRSKNGTIRKIREHKFPVALREWKKFKKRLGVSWNGLNVPIEDEQISTIRALSSSRESLEYPVYLLDGSIEINSALELESLERACAIGLAKIESDASRFTKRMNEVMEPSEAQQILEDLK